MKSPTAIRRISPHIFDWTYICVHLIAWLSFFPGFFDLDAYYSVADIRSGNFGNIQPAANQIFGRLLFMLWPHPAILILFQLFLGYINFALLRKTLREYRIHNTVNSVVSLLYIFFPPIIFLNLYYSRDVIFAYLYSILTLICLRIFVSARRPSGTIHIIFILLTIWIALSRHNAVPLLTLFPLAFAYVSRTKLRLRLFFRMFSIAVAGYICIISVVFPAIGVYPNEKSFPYYGFIHDVASIITHENNASLTRAEYEYYSRILPLEKWKEYYDPLNRNELIYHRLLHPDTPPHPDFAYFERDMNTARKMLFLTLIRNYPILLRSHTATFANMLAIRGTPFTGVLETSGKLRTDRPQLYDETLTVHPTKILRPVTVFLSDVFTMTVDNERFKQAMSPIFILGVWFVITWILIRKKLTSPAICLLPGLVYLSTFIVISVPSWIGYSFFLYIAAFHFPVYLTIMKRSIRTLN